ncbi:MAG: FHA domain-containing protein [Deltaproteobacteria bacterium]|nr:FHA domain-containing protein [Deltaproteobacteria bacterium]
MNVSNTLLEILACPKCQGRLSFEAKEEGVVCAPCSLFYPVENGKLQLVEEEALEMRQGVPCRNADKAKSPLAYFYIEEGPNQGEVVQLQAGHCKAIGRSIDDLNSTQIFSTEPTVPLDDFTKKLVLNYLAKKRTKIAASPAASSKSVESKSEGLGSFKRDADLVLNDPAISRLHAMLFNDESGAGVLDLVSRNGTYVNGQEVESKSLQEGDVVDVGSTKICFSLKKVR